MHIDAGWQKAERKTVHNLKSLVMEKITKVVEVEIDREGAFSKLLNEFNEWWPREYTWSQDNPEEIRIEGKKYGLCTEIGPYGFRCDWGRVTELTENRKIVIKWQISPKHEQVPNPEKIRTLTIFTLPK